MSEEIKKPEPAGLSGQELEKTQIELTDQELENVAGGGNNGKKGYGVGTGGDARVPPPQS